MKRLVCLLILSALLLSACSGGNSPILPSSPKPSSTEQTATKPTVTAPTTPEILPNGLSVKTDYSAYQPRVFTPKFTRLQSEPIYELQASDDYGKIYPFVGETEYISYIDGYVGSSGYSYGMVTQDGCIVADPVYSYVSRLTLPYWVLQKRTKSPESEYEVQTLYTIASLDGSVVTDDIYEGVIDGGDRILAIHNYDPLRFDLLDENLNVILSSEDLWESEHLAPYSVDYSEGALLLGYDLGRVDEYSYERRDYYYAYETGEIFAGPFARGYAFNAGMACVETEDGSSTFIDLQGKRMERSFLYAGSFEDGGVAVVETEETTEELIDRSGKTILSFPSETYYVSLEGDYLFVTNYETEADAIYRTDGTLLSDGISHSELTQIYGTCFYEHEDASKPYIIDVCTGKRYDIPAEGYTYCTRTWSEGDPFLILTYGEFGSQTYRILNAELEELAVDATDYRQTYGIGYLMVREKDGYALFNTEGERVGMCPLSRIETAEDFDDGVLAVSDGFASYLYDENFELLFCYPLTNAMED